MLVFLAVALAGPTWSNGQAELELGFVPSMTLRSPTGDIALSGERAMRIVDGEPEYFTLPYATDDRLELRCDVDGDGTDEYLELPPDHTARFRNLAGDVLLTLEAPTTASRSPELTMCADVDLDGHVEVGGTIGTLFLLWDDDGTLLIEQTQFGSYHPVAGQLDADPALEIVQVDGHQLDGVTLQVESVAPYPGSDLRLFDIDGDGIDEVLDRVNRTWQMRDNGVVLWENTQRRNASVTVGDFDGDGSAEVLMSDGFGQFADLLVLDAQTGRRRLPVTQGPVCGPWLPFDHDGDGDAQIFCFTANEVFDPATGEFRLFAGLDDSEPDVEGFDGDGDGHDDLLVWIQHDRVLITDGDGDAVAVLPVDTSQISVVDLDGPAGDELLVADRVWTWQPGLGVTEAPYSPLPFLLDGCVREVGDFDGDGWRELLLDNCRATGPIRVFHFDFGGVTEFGRAGPRATYTLDLDGDGIREIVGDESGNVTFWTADGVPLASVPGTRHARADMLGRERLLTASLADVRLYGWSGGPVRLGQFTSPRLNSPLAWIDDRLWYASAARETTAWSPSGEAPEVYPAAMSTTPPVLVSDVVWLGRYGFVRP
jgi:hypothetical protein